MFETLLAEAEGAIGRITLNRPDKLNPAFDPDPSRVGCRRALLRRTP